MENLGLYVVIKSSIYYGLLFWTIGVAWISFDPAEVETRVQIADGPFLIDLNGFIKSKYIFRYSKDSNPSLHRIYVWI